ncbi:uncharacterized protein LOC115209849 [Argonauta hians]
MNFIFLAVFITQSLALGSNRLLCYSCSYTYTDTKVGEECLHTPNNVATANTVNCNSKCYVRVVYTRGLSNDRVNSAVRGCWTAGLYEMYKKCTSSTHEETCTRICSGEKCNKWSLYHKDLARGNDKVEDESEKQKPDELDRVTEVYKNNTYNRSLNPPPYQPESHDELANVTSPPLNSTSTNPGARNCCCFLLIVITIALGTIA